MEAQAFRKQALRRIEDMVDDREDFRWSSGKRREAMEAERQYFRRQSERRIDEMEAYRQRLSRDAEDRYDGHTATDDLFRRWSTQRHLELGAEIKRFRRQEDDRFRELEADIQSYRRQEDVRYQGMGEDIRHATERADARYKAMTDDIRAPPCGHPRAPQSEAPRPQSTRRPCGSTRRLSTTTRAPRPCIPDRERSAEQLNAWAKRVEEGTQQRGKGTKSFCVPPFTYCSKCQVSKQTCRCTLSMYLSNIGPDAAVDFGKRMRKCLHPDRYTACEIPDVQKKASELFQIFEHVAARG